METLKASLQRLYCALIVSYCLTGADGEMGENKIAQKGRWQTARGVATHCSRLVQPAAGVIAYIS